MPNAIKWETAWVSRGTVLTTELDALADGAWSAAGPAYDNTTNLDQLAAVELNVDTVAAPAATGFVSIYMIESKDGTNYDTIDTDNDPRGEKQVATVSVIDTIAAQVRTSPGAFVIPPGKVKFILKNGMGTAFPATGSTLELFTANSEIQ